MKSNVKTFVPPLPEEIELKGPNNKSFQSKLNSGTYLLSLDFDNGLKLEGCLRIEILSSGKLVVSADLYKVENSWTNVAQVQEIPIFDLYKYHSYISVDEMPPTNDSLNFRFRSFKFKSNHADCIYDFDFRPNVYLANIDLEGSTDNIYKGLLLDKNEDKIGTLSFSYISEYYRKFDLQIHKLKGLKQISSAQEIAQIFEAMKLDCKVTYGDDIDEIHSKWTDSNLKNLLKNIKAKEAFDIRHSWKYFALSINHLSNNLILGRMFAKKKGDNCLPRDGCAIAAEWRFIKDNLEGKNGPIPESYYADIKGKMLQDVDKAYLRTLIHEVGHAFALDHNNDQNNLMKPTNWLIEEIRTKFPDQINFKPSTGYGSDTHRINHMPDAFIRPGLINDKFSNRPIISRGGNYIKIMFNYFIKTIRYDKRK